MAVSKEMCTSRKSPQKRLEILGSEMGRSQGEKNLKKYVKLNWNFKRGRG